MIANKCPYDDGIAVYQARSALYQLGYPLISNDCESTLPAQSGQRRLSFEENGEKTFMIYPNPTKESVNIQLEVKEDQEIYFELHDVIGKKVIKQRLNSHLLHTIELNGMHHGIYLYRLVSAEEVLQSGKLVIK